VVAPLPMPSSLGCLDKDTIAHNLLVIAYYILRDQTCYRDLGPDYFDRLNPEGLRRGLTKRLEGLGFKVTVEPLAEVA
jgi:transposase